MGVLVQKFGGTSVAAYEKMKEVCKIIESYKEEYKGIRKGWNQEWLRMVSKHRR